MVVQRDSTGPSVRFDDIDIHELLVSSAAGASESIDVQAELRALREKSPVFDGDAIVEVLGNPISATGFSGRRVLTILRYEECLAVLRDRERFSSSIMGDSYRRTFGHTIFELDDPEHKRLRSVVQRAFTPRAMERWSDLVISHVIDEALDALVGGQTADLYWDFTFVFPSRIIFEMCGLSPEIYAEFTRAALALLLSRSHPDVALEASHRLGEMLTRQLDIRRADPLEDDLVTVIAQAADAGSITHEEAVSFLRILLPGGAETTSHTTASLLWFLLHAPDQLNRVAADRSLVPAAVEEAMRLEPAVPYAHRVAVKDVAIGGVEIPAGSGIQLALGSANRDSSRWEEPDRFEVGRKPQPHLGFGSGSHTCIGAALGRREMAVALNAVLDRFPRLELDREAQSSRITGVHFRGPTSVPVRLG